MGTLADPVICPGAAVGMRYGVGDGVDTPGEGATVDCVTGRHEGTRQQESAGSVIMTQPSGGL